MSGGTIQALLTAALLRESGGAAFKAHLCCVSLCWGSGKASRAHKMVSEALRAFKLCESFQISSLLLKVDICAITRQKTN